MPIAKNHKNPAFRLYINVYRHKDGGITYSSDEFGVGDEGLFTRQEAITEALIMAEHGFEYLLTLSNETPVDLRPDMDAHEAAEAEQQREDARYGTYEQQHRLTKSQLL